jgi:hypothetical protein
MQQSAGDLPDAMLLQPQAGCIIAETQLLRFCLDDECLQPQHSSPLWQLHIGSQLAASIASCRDFSIENKTA